MNALGKNIQKPGYLAISLATLLTIGGCEKGGNGINDFEYSHHDGAPQSSELPSNIYLGFANSTVHLYDFEKSSTRPIFTFQTDAYGRTNFDRNDFASKTAGIDPQKALHLNTVNGGVIMDDLNAAHISDRVGYVISLGEINAVIDGHEEMRYSEAGLILGHELAKRPRDFLYHEDDIHVNNVLDQVTTSIAQTLGIHDQDGDGDVDFRDVRLSYDNQYAEDCVDISNNDLHVHNLAYNNIFHYDFGYAVQPSYGRRTDDTGRQLTVEYKTNNGPWQPFVTSSGDQPITYYHGDTIHTREYGPIADTDQINSYTR